MPFSKFLFLGFFSPHPPPRSFFPFLYVSNYKTRSFYFRRAGALAAASGDTAVGGTPPSPSAPPGFCLPGAGASQECWKCDALNSCARPASLSALGEVQGVRPKCMAHSWLE